MLDQMTVLTAETFGIFTTAETCLVLIFKYHCPYCKVLMKVIEKCLPLYPNLKVGGVISEENPLLLETIGVSKVPTILIYKQGSVADRCSGIMNHSELSALIEKATV